MKKKRSIPNHSEASYRPCKGVETPSRREGKRGQPGALVRKTRSPIFLPPSVPQSSGRWSRMAWVQIPASPYHDVLSFSLI